jgi:hypothetical protein
MMVEVEILTPTYNEESQTVAWEGVALVRAAGDQVTIYGDESVVQPIRVVSITHGKSIDVDEDVEEWARSLPDAYRTGDLVAVVRHDDNPPAAEVDADIVEPHIPHPPVAVGYHDCGQSALK